MSAKVVQSQENFRRDGLPVVIPCPGSAPTRWGRRLLAGILVAAVLAAIPGRSKIPPLVESDYSYLLTAADRFFAGDGLTTTPPVAPLQSWDWTTDWTFLTKWPIGYPLLVVSVRWLTGGSTLQACGWISVCASALALVGWFAWSRRCVPGGIASMLVAAVTAGCAVSTGLLLNPSTDLVIVAALPFLLLFITDAISAQQAAGSSALSSRGWARFLVGGVLAGLLFWIRYASVFVPIAILVFLFLISWKRARSVVHRVIPFAVGAVVPMVSLLVINRINSSPGSLQEQLNLGKTVSWDLSLSLIGTAWWRFTDLGFYNYYSLSHWILACWPVTLVAVALLHKPSRLALWTFLKSPGIALSAVTLVALLTMLVGATGLFGDKYRYVELDRYYVSGRPFYLVLFVGPLFLIRGRMIKVLLTLVLLVACSWTVQQEWTRPYKRWLAAEREATPYGQWARSFSPGASDLYARLAEEHFDDLIVVSNFHDYIVLETGIPAIPVPKSPEVLNSWIEKIVESRGLGQWRVMFVLDPNNRWRNYFALPYDQTVAMFGLHQRISISDEMSAVLFRYAPSRAPTAHRTIDSDQ